MSAQDLAEYIYNEAVENPAIDIDALQVSELRNKIDWLRRTDRSARTSPYGKDEEGSPSPEQPGKNMFPDTVQEHLRAQLYAYKLSEKERQITNYLIACVDSKGYLDEDVEYTAALFDTSSEDVEHCFDLLRSLSPVGICTANLQQCLKKQILQFPEDIISPRIIDEHLEDLAKGRYSNIAKKLKVSIAEVRAAANRIKALSPIPAAGFDSEEEIFYSIPDAQIIAQDDHAEASLFRSYTAQVHIDQYYSNMYRVTDDAALKDYLDGCLKSAYWLIKSISQREQTLISCLSVICEIQQSFFLGESPSLVPMTMSDVAERLGVHVSTVSRAIRNKSIQCSSGVIPIKDLFSRALNNTLKNRSTDEVKKNISELIGSEDKRNPLSDQQLSNILKAKGLSVSRRTVAKYREQMELPSTLLRKKSPGN